MSRSRDDAFDLSHRGILALAVPVMISNVSTPLLGVVDTAVVGQLPEPSAIGAVALGGTIFSFVFWAFGFLRMGTTGMSAQALGAGDRLELRAVLLRGLSVAGIAGGGILLLQWPLRELSLSLVDGSEAVEEGCRAYFDGRVWSAPATLANFTFIGWFVGRGRTDLSLGLQLLLNLSNMVLDAFFVLGLGWGVTGVGVGTCIAEWIAAIAGVALALRHLRELALPPIQRAHLFDRSALRRTFVVNTDIMIRTLALVAAFAFFTAEGASTSDAVLAANAVLMQFISVSAYFLDGLAFAAEALVGRALGANLPEVFLQAVRRTTSWAFGIAFCLSLTLLLSGDRLVSLLTADAEIQELAGRYQWWAALAPIAGVLAFQLDGIFIGATRTREMRNASVLSLFLFLGAWAALRGFGNDGLWGALYAHYVARILTLGVPFRKWRTWMEAER